MAKENIVITGATAGIGRALCELLASDERYHILAVGRREERLKSLKEKHPSIEILAADITQAPPTLQKRLVENQVDVLINNAGLALGTESLEQTSEAHWQKMIDTNISALVRLTQWVIPQMKSRQQGDIVNVGSIAGFQTYAGGVIYNATKFAVRAITEALRKELLGQNIRVMGIHPGMVETEFSEVRYQGDKEKAKSVYAGMRPLKAEDAAEAIRWMLSQPKHICVESLRLMPTDQAAVGLVYRRSRL